MTNFTPIFTALIAFAVCGLMGFPFIPYLRKLKYGQTILDEGPKWHKNKQGTPTMGGIMIVAGVIVAIILAMIFSAITDKGLINELKDSYNVISLFGGLIFALFCGIIGLIDDYIKVVKKRNLGLTAKQKTVLQLIAIIAFLTSQALSGVHTTWIPFVGDVNIMSGFGLIFWPIALVFIYFMVNAVNLTDGIDGLASTVTLIVCCAYMLLAGRTMSAAFYGNGNSMSVFAAAVGGSCLGFLMWNNKPAKVFMGDTGSMFLGGAVIAMAFGSGRPVLLILIGIIYILEALSVVLQVFWFKTFKKRIFKMSPIHHHFEMSGWSEEKICLVFGLVTMVASFFALLPVFLGK